MTQDIPRRSRLDLMIPAERDIYDAMQVVEAMRCDVRLTEAVVLLQRARDRVADFVDGVDSQPEHKGLACEDRCGTRLETWWCAACNAKHGRPPHQAQEVNTLVAQRALAVARIKSLEDGIVAENKRTSAIEVELEAVKNLLIARDEDFHPDGEASVAQVVERILNERDDAERERDEARGAIPDETSGAVAASFSREGEASRERDRANARPASSEEELKQAERVRNSFAAQSRSLDAADERASTATDVLCRALGKDHGRGGLVEHCQKAADKIGALEQKVHELSHDGVCSEILERDQNETIKNLRTKLVEAERVRDAVADGERVTYEICENLRADQRATGDVLAGILGRQRCEDGNVCLANDVSAWVERLQVLMHDLNRDFTTLADLSDSNAKELARQINLRQRGVPAPRFTDPRLQAVADALLGSKDSSGSGAAASTTQAIPGSTRTTTESITGRRGQSDEGATPEPAGGSSATAWPLAIGEALGWNSGFNVPIFPDVEAFRKLFEDVRKSEWHRIFGGVKDADVAELNGGYCTTCRLLRRICGGEEAHEKEAPLAADEVTDLQQGAKAAMGQLIMRSDLVAACKRAGLTGLVAELEREP